MREKPHRREQLESVGRGRTGASRFCRVSPIRRIRRLQIDRPLSCASFSKSHSSSLALSLAEVGVSLFCHEPVAQLGRCCIALWRVYRGCDVWRQSGRNDMPAQCTPAAVVAQPCAIEPAKLCKLPHIVQTQGNRQSSTTCKQYQSRGSQIGKRHIRRSCLTNLTTSQL